VKKKSKAEEGISGKKGSKGEGIRRREIK